ncbi:DUF4097 family beta strand repeat-containing protein [Lachnoclostridium sp. An181]|uniref:DUF4097 family beta strand repeat-containing protein n=1 Tax=Lachnoclostridium sp. An181 TaxID=1965575 RepID=UPI000B3ABD1D|nr:DUF4097 family beta strand repeat-containing protein [Lachnoclostridium sp. An181]OUP49569.1 hypothetical protein B5F18_07140 [Lachnoclostridium sp. An181]
MKKGWKIFWGICGSVFAVGCILCIVSLALGFSWKEAKRLYPHGIGVVWRNERQGEYYSGEEFIKTYKGVKEIEVDVYASWVNIYTDEELEDEVRVECQNIPSDLQYNAYMDGGKLKIETRKKVSNGTEDATVDIYLPKSVYFEQAGVHIGAGSLSVDGLRAKKMEMEVGAGAGEVLGIETEELSAKVGAGGLTLEGDVKKEAKLECRAGSLSATWAGKKTDFNYETDVSGGTVLVGNDEMQFEKKQEINNHAAKNMELDCAAGEMVIEFMEE